VSGPVLRTSRLVLRPCRADDVAALHALWTDRDVRRWLWDDVVIPEASARDVVSESLATFAERGFGQWVLAEREDGALLGCAGLRPFDSGREIELLYALHPSRWGEGLATEAARAVLEHGFRALGLPRIAARVDTPNRASARVLERHRMRIEGEREVQGRPTLHYALGREEFLIPPPRPAPARG
jgi:ribosomal-protein-alanine N-acetyltransferase